MSTFVLIHGAYVGGWIWNKLAPLLRAAGHEAFTPTLTGLGERVHLGHPDIDLHTHITDVVNVLEFEDLHNVVLVGWSYGGMVITGAADRVPNRLAQLVYLDATVPEDGQNLYDCWPNSEEWRAKEEARVSAIGDGWRLYFPEEALDEQGADLSAADRVWVSEKLTGQPFKTMTQPLRLQRTTGDEMSRTYIQCTSAVDPSRSEPAFLQRARTEPTWQYLTLPASHLAPVSAPQETALLLLSTSSLRKQTRGSTASASPAARSHSHKS